MNTNIMNKLVKVDFQPGDILFQENESSYHFYIIQEGEVLIQRQDEDGSTIDLANLGPGTSVGEFAHIDRKPRSASVRAKTAVSAVMVSEEAYDELLEGLPTWSIAMIEGLVERLRKSNQMIQELRHLDPETRHKLNRLLDSGAEGSTVWNLEKPF